MLIVQMPLENRTLFQMDQTTLTYQNILRHIRKCPQIANLDCDIYLHTGSHYQKRTETQTKSLHNSTNFKRKHIRENSYISSTYRN